MIIKISGIICNLANRCSRENLGLIFLTADSVGPCCESWNIMSE